MTAGSAHGGQAATVSVTARTGRRGAREGRRRVPPAPRSPPAPRRRASWADARRGRRSVGRPGRLSGVVVFHFIFFFGKMKTTGAVRRARQRPSRRAAARPGPSYRPARRRVGRHRRPRGRKKKTETSTGGRRRRKQARAEKNDGNKRGRTRRRKRARAATRAAPTDTRPASLPAGAAAATPHASARGARRALPAAGGTRTPS